MKPVSYSQRNRRHRKALCLGAPSSGPTRITCLNRVAFKDGFRGIEAARRF